MKSVFQIGDTKEYIHVVTEADTAVFQGKQVHPVYATYALARDAEWVCRQFVIDMKEDDEEGIGTFVQVYHQSPAIVGETVQFIATLRAINGHEIICSFRASSGNRLIAEGTTGQKILKRQKIREIIDSLQKHHSSHE